MLSLRKYSSEKAERGKGKGESLKPKAKSRKQKAESIISFNN